MKMNSDFTLQRQGLLLGTLRKVLKPCVRLLLTHGITYTQMLEELKRVFVQVADEEFVINGKRQTDSRITLLTGVHRKMYIVFEMSKSLTVHLNPVLTHKLLLNGSVIAAFRMMKVDQKPYQG